MLTLRDRVRSWIPPLIGLALFGVALAVLRRELHQVSWDEFAGALTALPVWQIAVAIGLTAFNYLVLTGYDQLAFLYIGNPLDKRRIAAASFVAYGIANSVGFATISGTSVRYRFYSRWGVSPGEISRVIVNYSTTFWLGLLVLGGWTMVASPLTAGLPLLGRGVAQIAGWVCFALAGAYALLPILRRRPLRIGSFELPIPSPGLVLAQFALSIVDWAGCALIVHFLLPAGTVPVTAVVGSFLIAQLVGLVSHVPGGLGVFESTMVLLLKPFVPAGTVLASLALFRLIYYVVPLAGAIVVLAVDEARLRRRIIARAASLFGAMSESLAPRLLAVLTFAAGVILLVSGATPAEPARLDWLSRMLPLPALETSHFLGSVTGVVLLLLSNGIARRLDASYHLSLAALGTGIVASLLKGGDWEEALLLALLVVVLIPSRGKFDRRAAFFDASFSPDWLVAVVAAVGASVWLVFFAFRHVEYAHDLWWVVEFDADVSRSLRASVGAAVVLLVAAGLRLMRPAPHEVVLPTDEEMAEAEKIVRAQPSTQGYLALLRDKGLLFDEARQGFIMYAVQGRTWAAMGDPVGPESVTPGLICAFIERCDDFGGWPVFYEVGKERLHLYADRGLAFMKLGEQARVDLAAFSLDGSSRKGLRMAQRRVVKDGGSFRIVPAEEVPTILDELEAVSNEWMKEKAAAEKGFSLGFFDRAYVARTPVALIEKGGRIEAFANLWPGAPGTELTVDLMRHRESELRNLMDALFVNIMLWGQERGYRWFDLGMASLSGLDAGPVAPLWAKLGALVFRYGETFYNFQGLRQFKEKFDPVWEPRYLAYPGGMSLPAILADVSALIAGGYRKMFFK